MLIDRDGAEHFLEELEHHVQRFRGCFRGGAGPRVIVGVEDLRALVGSHLGVSDWLTIEQSRINEFAAVTRDKQWIHVDAGRAEHGPFGATVALAGLDGCRRVGAGWPAACDRQAWSCAVDAGRRAAATGEGEVGCPA